MKVQEALKAAIEAMEIEGIGGSDAAQLCKSALSEIGECEPVLKVYQGEICYKSQADNQSYGMWCPVNFDTEHFIKEGTEFYTSPQPIEKCEPVAEAIRERDRLGFAVVNVIGKLDEIIENTQEVEVDDFLHIAVPVDMWNELQESLEDMPKRADLYTSPQPIEKCEPVAYIHKHYLNEDKDALDWHKREHPQFKMIPLYTSPQPRECEPVGEVDVDGFGMKEIRWKGYHWTHILSVGDKLYTSPISKED